MMEATRPKAVQRLLRENGVNGLSPGGFSDTSGSCPEINWGTGNKKMGELWAAPSCPMLWNAHDQTCIGASYDNLHFPTKKSTNSDKDEKVKETLKKRLKKGIKKWWANLEPCSSWALLFLVIIPMNILNGVDWVSFSVYYVAYAEHFPHETRSSIGVTVAIRETVSCAFGIITSALIRRYGCFTTAFASGILFFAGLFLSSFTPNIMMLYITQGVITGIANSLNFITSNFMLQKNFSTNRGLGSGMGMLGYTTGNVAGLLIVDFLIDRFGWRGCLLIHSGILAHIILLSMLAKVIRPELMTKMAPPEVRENGYADYEEDDTQHHNTKFAQICVQLKSFLRDVFDFSLFKEVTFVLVCFGTMLFRWNEITFYQHMPSRAVSLGMTRSDGADLVALTSVIACVCRLLVTGISNMNCVNRVLFYNSGYIMAAAGSFTIVIFESYLGQQMGAVLAGLHTGIANTLVYVMMVDLFTVDKLARSMALTEITYIIVAVSAAPVGGYLYDVTGSYDAAFLLAGSMVALGGVLVLIVVIIDVCRRRRENAFRIEDEGPRVAVQVNTSD